MSKFLKISSSHFYSIIKLLRYTKNKEKVFISNATHVTEILSFHHDRDIGRDLFITFNIDRYANKFFNRSFYKAILKLLGRRDDRVAFILYNCSTRKTIDLIKLLFPKCTIYIKYVDVIKDIFKNTDELNQCVELASGVDTYSRRDANLYGLNYVPNIVNKKKLNDLSQKFTQQNDTFLFVGTYSPSRFAYLLKLLKLNINDNIKYKFILLIENKPENSHSLQTVQEINASFSYHPFTIIDRPISYSKYLEEFAKASGLIDFYRLESDEGFSYRVLECVATNKKLITNRHLDKESFFLQEMIFNIDIDSISDFNKFLKSDLCFNQDTISQLQHYLHDAYLPKDN